MYPGRMMMTSVHSNSAFADMLPRLVVGRMLHFFASSVADRDPKAECGAPTHRDGPKNHA